MATSQRTQQTFHYERLRAISSGILETAGTTFLLLIALRWFNAGATPKALIAAGGSVGLLISPWVVSTVEKSGMPVAQAAARLAAVGAVSFLVMAMVPWLPVFTVGSVISMASAASLIPLLTQMYQENYDARERGKLFSKTMIIRIGTAAVFAELAGRALSVHIDYFRWLLLVFAGASAFAGYCLHKCPSRPLIASGGSHPFRAMRYVREDKLFRRTLICWMFMGFANLMMLPLRIEYLGSPKYKLELSVAEIALLTSVIPNMARLALSPVWGWLFDRMNFFLLRVTLNLGFALGIVAFFTSDDLTGLLLGAVIHGCSNAGGDVAWSLWVTKFAPPDRVADYMSVHTFFTGLRGVVAPLAAFHMIQHFTLFTLGWMSAAMIVVATLLLVPEIRFGKKEREASALVEEVSD